MKPWKGRWLMVVSALHAGVGFAVFGQVFGSIMDRGVINTVGTDPMTGLAVWFVLFGAVLCLFGLALNELEKALAGPLPRVLGWALLALVALGVTLMPASGFWLAVPPAVAILRGKPAQLPLGVIG